jgi:triosephosphate isomerase
LLSRKPIVAGNWKMNTSVVEGSALAAELVTGLAPFKGVERVLCVPFTHLFPVAHRVSGTEIGLGAQNIHPEPKGAYTGEVAVNMLPPEAKYVIIGHSERRQYFGEDDAFVNRKVKVVLEAGLTPIVCVGETLEQNEAGETSAVVTRQITQGLAGISELPKVVVAYEPIWAIGTGRAATAEGANATCGEIRRALASLNTAAAPLVRIQYGGSVTADNFAEIIAQPEIDGALVGGASLKADQFVQIVKLAQP